MTWIYVGTLAFAEVRIEPFAVHSGPNEDDFETQWRASEGQHGCSFAMFVLRHGI